MGVSTESNRAGPPVSRRTREAVWKEISWQSPPSAGLGRLSASTKPLRILERTVRQATRPVALQTFEGTMDHRATGTIAILQEGDIESEVRTSPLPSKLGRRSPKTLSFAAEFFGHALRYPLALDFLLDFGRAL